MGNLVFQATLGGQVNLVGPNTASTFNINIPTVNGTFVTTGDTGTVTNTMLASSAYTAPGTIGSGTPNTGAFTTLSASGVASFAAGSASAPALTRTGDTNTGMFFPAADTIAFAEGGTEAMRLDSAGNMGLGVTPSAWRSTEKALQIGNAAVFLGRSDNLVANMASNWYVTSGGTNTYIATGNASLYQQLVGEHRWFNAASGTAGNAITFTQAMTLDASGNLMLGTTSTVGGGNVNFTMNGSAAVESNLLIGGTKTALWYADSASVIAGSVTSIPYVLRTGNTERARIDSSGNFQVSNLAGSGNRAVYSTSTGILTNSSSDRTLKTDDQTISQGLDAVSAMRPVNFKWVDEERFGAQREIGFIAQEMQELVPEVVGTNHDGTLSIDYPKLTAVLVKAVQELSAKVAVLEAK